MEERNYLNEAMEIARGDSERDLEVGHIRALYIKMNENFAEILDLKKIIRKQTESLNFLVDCKGGINA